MSQNVEQAYFIFGLPILDTLELIEHMPQNKWVVPKPYKAFDRPETMQSKVDSYFFPWANLLVAAQRGSEQARQTMEEGILTGDLPAIRACIEVGEIAGLIGKNEDEKIKSALHGFASLISREALSQLSLKKRILDKASEDDIYNAKTVVEHYAKTVLQDRLHMPDNS